MINGIPLFPTEPLHSPGGVDTSCLGGRMYTGLVDGVSEDLLEVTEDRHAIPPGMLEVNAGLAVRCEY